MITVRTITSGRDDDYFFSRVRHKSLVYVSGRTLDMRSINLDTLELDRVPGTSSGIVLAVHDDCIYFRRFSSDIYCVRGSENPTYLGSHHDTWYAAINAAGTRMYTTNGRSIRVWDLETLVNIQTVVTDNRCIIIHPDGSRLFSGSYSKILGVWDIDHDGFLTLKTQRNCGVMSMVLSNDGTTLVTSFENRLCIWDAETMRVKQNIILDSPRWPYRLIVDDHRIIDIDAATIHITDFVNGDQRQVDAASRVLDAGWQGRLLRVTTYTDQTFYVTSETVQQVVARAFRRELGAVILSYV